MKIILLSMLLICFSNMTFAKSGFITECQNNHKSEELEQHFKWISLLLKTDNCYLLHKKISNIKSLSQIIPSNENFGIDTKSSWTNNFPYLNGLINSEDLSSTEYRFIDTLTVSQNIDLYQEFLNIFHITYKTTYSFVKNYTVCEIIKKFPQVRQITIDPEVLNDYESDKCISIADIEIIISGKFTGFKKVKENNQYPLSRIIGFEEYQDTFENLIFYPYVRYLGISEVLGSQGSINTLSQRLNITHFSMNINGIRNIESLANLINLTNLTIYCVSFLTETFTYESGCQGNQLTNISFLKKLSWLKQINLNSNFIEDLKPLEDLVYLEKIELGSNQIKMIPNLSKLKNLRYLDLSNNILGSLKNIEKITSLNYLDISENGLVAFTEIPLLKKLSFLNISNNFFQGKLDSFQVPDSLRVLDISGARVHPQENPIFNYMALDFLDKDQPFSINYYNMIRLKNNINDFPTTPFVSNGIDFAKFKNLEAIIMNNNNLTMFPNIAQAKKLKLIDLERNKIKNIPHSAQHPGIKVIDLSANEIDQFPDFSIFPKLHRIDLISNGISSFNNLSTSRNPKMWVAISNNRIENLAPISTDFFKDYEFELEGNPVKKESQSCPFVFNSTITGFCHTHLEIR